MPVPFSPFGKNAATDQILEHFFGEIADDIGQPFVIILAMLSAKFLKVIEKVASEKAGTYADFEDKNVRFQPF